MVLRDTRATPSCPSSSCDPLRIRSPPRRLLGGLGHLAAFARCPSASSSVRSCLFVAVATRLVPCDAEALCGCAWRVHVLTSRPEGGFLKAGSAQPLLWARVESSAQHAGGLGWQVVAGGVRDRSQRLMGAHCCCTPTTPPQGCSPRSCRDELVLPVVILY